jgi:hypothetical protein
MTKSLKSCIPQLARLLDETPDALYERVRALDREGLLKSVPGKGPGSGVRATADSFAMLLIAALMGSVSLIESGPRARAIAKAKSTTGGGTFREALASILASEESAARVREIHVAVTHGKARIEFDDVHLSFVCPASEKLAVRINVAIDGATVDAFARVLAIAKVVSESK